MIRRDRALRAAAEHATKKSWNSVRRNAFCRNSGMPKSVWRTPVTVPIALVEAHGRMRK